MTQGKWAFCFAHAQATNSSLYMKLTSPSHIHTESMSPSVCTANNCHPARPYLLLLRADTRAIEAAGTAPIRPLLRMAEQIRDGATLVLPALPSSPMLSHMTSHSSHLWPLLRAHIRPPAALPSASLSDTNEARNRPKSHARPRASA